MFVEKDKRVNKSLPDIFSQFGAISLKFPGMVNRSETKHRFLWLRDRNGKRRRKRGRESEHARQREERDGTTASGLWEHALEVDWLVSWYCLKPCGETGLNGWGAWASSPLHNLNHVMRDRERERGLQWAVSMHQRENPPDTIHTLCFLQLRFTVQSLTRGCWHDLMGNEALKTKSRLLWVTPSVIHDELHMTCCLTIDFLVELLRSCF